MEISSKILEDVLIFAIEKHRGQVRKNSDRPYILHPFDVAYVLGKVKISKNRNLLTAVAVLHDCVEDCDVTIEEIGRLFGWQIASVVDELTTNEEEKNALGKKEYLSRKMVKMSSYALCAKLTDRYCNLDECAEMTNDFIVKIHDETRYILDSLYGTKRSEDEWWDGKVRKFTKTHQKLIAMIENKLDELINKLYPKEQFEKDKENFKDLLRPAR